MYLLCVDTKSLISDPTTVTSPHPTSHGRLYIKYVPLKNAILMNGNPCSSYRGIPGLPNDDLSRLDYQWGPLVMDPYSIPSSGMPFNTKQIFYMLWDIYAR
ncbi:hypothetical protein GDO78_002370 [Eleutherodactylus coqui]|uniref:Uncharacterized protein n=1 Tax=Eleutherodactylus coqui TaxID=57060 RepID=A0A8J6EYE0_ELECQ|nr:hypothetical protein GDO78_002370 [Eleutherodactylus coqui]